MNKMNYTTKAQKKDVRDLQISRLTVLSVLLSSIDVLSSPLNKSIDGEHHSLLI
jgi:hypothetical protein